MFMVAIGRITDGTITGTALIGAGIHGLGQAGALVGAGVTRTMEDIMAGAIRTTAGAVIIITEAITIITRTIPMSTTAVAGITIITADADAATLQMERVLTLPVQEAILILQPRGLTAHRVLQTVPVLKLQCLASTTTIATILILLRDQQRQHVLTRQAVQAAHEAVATAAAVQAVEAMAMAAVHAVAEEDNAQKEFNTYVTNFT
jgi:hypothetical protein